MSHVQTMINTQRIMCLSKYGKGYVSPWKQILYFFLKDHGGNFLLHCNFSAADLPKLSQISTENVSRPGKILSVKPVLSRKQALNQLLWNSQFLRIDAKPIFNNKLFSKGLISLADVWTNTDSLNCWTFFKAEGLNLNDYLLLYGPNTELNYTLYLKEDTLPLVSITSSKLYWKLIEIIQVYPSARHEFSTLFQDNGDLDWEVTYQIPHVVTLHTKTRVFLV